MKKRLGGFKNIHVAKLNEDGTFVTPIALTGAKSIEAELAYETVQFYADNAMDFSDFIFTGGEGTLTVAGLTMSEYNTLFGSTVTDGGVLVKSTDIAPEVAILFERNKLGSSDKVYYALYACKFAPPSISAQTFEGGIEEEVVELTFTVREVEDGSVFYMLDSGEHAGTKASAWYETVQKA
ncbi:major tail protein [Ureibacillus aquaedulcis]|uniref:Phage tail protein n=1 Tax=Ureibacillus aquaedulcis TaxID=3058421 RepID=A0ABT8GNA0_9BACL|nr:major tail protein [Ureibacillus sp. BA0131]MDN4492891.1 phage tail protein [Ureibacillus sp. BA0131]